MFKRVLGARIFSKQRRNGMRIFLSLFIFLICIWIFTGSKEKDISEPKFKDRHGTAIIITGAAAKIVQEAALLEQLQKKGMLNDVVFISGASSGALNATVLNAVLSKKFTWQQYIRILSGITNNDIFIRDGRKLPVNTQPLRNLITRIVIDSLGYNKMSDLPYATSFSIVNLKVLSFKDRTYRLCNRQINMESDSTLNIVDILMASTAIPLAFPPSSIRDIKNIPDIPYHDGGVAADHVPYHALIEFEKYSGFEVEKMIIISRKRDTIPNMTRELEQFGIDKFKFFDKLEVSPESISNRGFYKRLKELQEESPSLAERTLVYVPNFKEEFLMLDFSTLKEQYEVTTLWAQTHSPLKLSDYLKSKKLD
jgi:predicted acylesterase/phospholipase RssA